jgi:hypothetical protein
MDPQMNQPQNNSTGPGVDPTGQPVPAPVQPDNTLGQPGTTAMNAPAAAPVGQPPAVDQGVAPVPSAIPDPAAPKAGSRLPIGLLVVAAVVLIGIILALVLL